MAGPLTDVIPRMEALARDFERLELEFTELWEGPGPKHETETEQEARRWAGNYGDSLRSFGKQIRGRISNLRERVDRDTSRVASGRFPRRHRRETKTALEKTEAAHAALMAAAEALRACGKTKTATSLEARTEEAWQPVVDALRRDLAACGESPGG